MDVKFTKLGGSVAVVVPAAVARDLKIKPNAVGTLHVSGNTMSIAVGRPKYTLDDLLAQSPKKIPIDNQFDRAKPVGKETI